MEDTLTSGALALIVGLYVLCPILVWNGSRMRRGSLPRNTDFGIRTRHTESNDLAWLQGHYAASGLTELAGWWSLVWAAIGTALTFSPVNDLIAPVFGYIGLSVICVSMWITADKAARPASRTAVDSDDRWA